MFNESELQGENDIDDSMLDEEETDDSDEDEEEIDGNEEDDAEEEDEPFDESYIEIENDMPEELKNVITKFNQQHEKVLTRLKNGSSSSENRLVSDDDDDDDSDDYESADSNLGSDDISETNEEVNLDDIF